MAAGNRVINALVVVTGVIVILGIVFAEPLILALPATSSASCRARSS